MASPFEDFVNAELPARIVIIRGATDATGDPNVSVAPLVNAAPAGSFYQQDETTPKALWVKDGPLSTDWVELGDAGGGSGSGFVSVEDTPTDLQTNFPAADNDEAYAIVNASTPTENGIYLSNGTTWSLVSGSGGGAGFGATELDTWELDSGSQPFAVEIGNFVADSFDGYTEIAIYTEETLGISYDKDSTITFRYQYAMSGTATDQVQISLGYAFRGNTFTPTVGYTEVADSFSAEGDTDVHTRTITIPAQGGLTDERPILSLRFRRLGDTDANVEDFNLFSTIIFQD
jgi:hypothetical protein